jgi:UDP-N-acetylmuramate--alanine ligase
MNSLTNLVRFYKHARFHFSGIGGIGMSGLAEIVYKLGYEVQGSDIASNYNTERLERLGIKVFYKQDGANLAGVSFLIKSSAIKKGNAEIVYCEKHGIPVIHRAALLKELIRPLTSISVSGTHGKTTTTSLIASIFECAKLDPSMILGGIIKDKNTNVQMGSSNFIVVEADESDGTFIQIPSTIAVVTNIAKEHLDHYGSFERLKEAFYQFVSGVSFYGFAVVCADDANVRSLIKQVHDREVITYGLNNKSADVAAVNIRQVSDHSIFDIVFSEKLGGTTLNNVKLNIPGLHNVQNALAGAAIAARLKLNLESVRVALKNFSNVKRRFTVTQEVNGIKFVDDYAHHPSEVQATINTARQMVAGTDGRIIAVFQPHRYSRLRDLFSEFVHSFQGADVTYVADVYSAQEAPIDGVNSGALVSEMKKLYSDKAINTLSSWQALPDIIKESCRSNDLVLFMGAGDITMWAHKVPALLSSLLN